MTTTPGADEARTRRALDQLGVSYAPQPPADGRERDWLDDLWADDTTPPRHQPATPPPAPPEPPEPPKGTAQDTGEPRWDWRRLLHWPNARLTCGLCAALAATVFPIPPAGYSAATTWAYVVQQTRANHGAGWGYLLGVGAFALAAASVARRGRRSGAVRLAFLAITAVGLTGVLSWYDPITFFTGVTR